MSETLSSYEVGDELSFEYVERGMIVDVVFVKDGSREGAVVSKVWDFPRFGLRFFVFDDDLGGYEQNRISSIVFQGWVLK